MDCLRRALSDVFLGKKLIIPSNGRWDGSMAGKVGRDLLIPKKRLDRRRVPVGVGVLNTERWLFEDLGEAGVLLKPERLNAGVGGTKS